MEFLRSFSSRTPLESKSVSNSPVQTFLEDQDESSSNPNGSVRKFVEDLDENSEGSSNPEMGRSFSSESRKCVISSPANKPSRTTFVPVDELPLHFRSGGSGRTNPMESLPFSVGAPPHFSQLARDHESGFGEFPIHHDAFTGGGDRSVRRLSGVENVTTRETKRPKERSKDKDYRRMTLTRSNFPHITFPDLPSAGIGQSSVERPNGSGRRIDVSPVSPVPSPSFPKPDGGSQPTRASGFQPEENLSFEIKLVHEGRTVVQRVHATTPAIYLFRSVRHFWSRA